MSEWQTMDSAPKDGTKVLGYGMTAGEINGIVADAEMLVISYSNGRSDYPTFHWDVAGGDAYACWMRPTHWMPLPAPPMDPGIPIHPAQLMEKGTTALAIKPDAGGVFDGD